MTGSRDSDGASPVMAQWFACKKAHPHALLFFRMGDFYELFFEDAVAAAGVLGIALTHRGTHEGEPIAMCGVPVHAAEAYLLRLIRRGFRVAIAEQLEDTKTRTGRGPMRREVVRLITPGTLTEDALLEAGRPNRLLALAPQVDAPGAAWLDLSTGTFETQPLAPDGIPTLLGRLDPAEIIAPTLVELGEWERRRAPDADLPSPLKARARVAAAFAAANLDALGNFNDGEAVAAAAALDYAQAASGGKLPLLSPPRSIGRSGRMELDAATRASLEITRARDGGSAHTLLAAVQRTQTAAGARLLGEHLAAPLLDPAIIAARQDAWSWMLANPAAAAAARAALRGMPDLSRALGRLSLGRGAPRDLAAVRTALDSASAAAAVLDESTPALLAATRAALLPDPELPPLLAACLAEPAPVRPEPGMIRDGFDPELDALRRLRDDSRRVIAGLQLDLAQRHGIASLKIRHHAQLGYVIEVPSAAGDTLRAQGLILRQSLASTARFTSDEVNDLDRRITEAAEQAATRERGLFDAMVRRSLHRASALADCADALALLDVALSATALAESGRWSRPVVTDDGAWMIRAGRHPVVEAALDRSARFIPNDCDLSPGRQVLLLTGPNMAGKSTFLRQNALIAILAQAGQPVPAAHAQLGIADRLFSRVGGADDLARGRSTFMVEMTETAAILHQAGPSTLVVVDEIGRGTATLDGLAIAWAVLESLHSTIRCRTIFATHFHELAQLGAELPRLRPHTMRVREWKGAVTFLHEVAEGAAGRSWGVHVAQLAGVPSPVVRRAAHLLTALEERAGRLTDAGALPLFAAARPAEPSPEPSADEPFPYGSIRDGYIEGALRAALAKTRPDELSPRAALELIYQLHGILRGDDQKEMLKST